MKNNLLVVLLIPLFILSWSQGCSRTGFSDLNSLVQNIAGAGSSSASGNGGTYDGKLRILHHYADHFTCEGKSEPESILIRVNSADWLVIKNTNEKCAAVDQAPVTGVIYDDVSKQAKFENKIYIPPRPYVVDPNEDPNLPDVKVIDGVCEDINGKCSLLASLQSAGVASVTDAAMVIVPAAIYKLNAEVILSTGPNGHDITIAGSDPSTTFFDGQNKTNILRIFGQSGNIKVENLKFQNANATMSALNGVAVDNNLTGGNLTIKNSVFENNVTGGGGTIGGPTTAPIQIIQSKFLNNGGGQATIDFCYSPNILIDQSIISSTNSIGVMIQNCHRGSVDVRATIRNSLITKISNLAVEFESCIECRIENSTLTENPIGVLYVNSDLPGTVTEINNSTFYHNNLSPSGFLLRHITSTTDWVTFNNSIIVQGDATKFMCSTPLTSKQGSFEAYNILSDDVSCIAKGGMWTGVVDPMLSPLSDNGGFTPTILPLPGSPAIDRGDNFTCLTTDQRGFPRPINMNPGGPQCDLGAVEVQ